MRKKKARRRVPTKKGTLVRGDALRVLKTLPKKRFKLVISSPPYNIGKIYERDGRTLEQYLKWQDEIIENLVNCVADDGSICWQVGNFVQKGALVPLDIIFYEMFTKRGMKLRNRIIWKFNFGLNADRRFSGRYETLLWFTKTDSYTFNLDPVRIPQLYPGKRHPKTKVGKAGQPSGNPKGKNPSDYWEFSAEKDFKDNPIWDIPNVKANHPEKTKHPCQFPIELAERCVLAFSNIGDAVLDPFVGTGATVIASAKHDRKSLGIDRDASFLRLASRRIEKLTRGELPMRPLGKPIRRPIDTEKVSKPPEEWSFKEIPKSKTKKKGVQDAKKKGREK